jgi:hypothetical protein
MNAKSNGNPNSRYNDRVEISYVDGNGSNNTYGVFTGSNQSTVNVTINGEVQSVTVSLSNALNTNKSLSVNLSSVDYCSGVPPCPDSDNDGVCNSADQCPGFDDNLIGTACDDGIVCTTNDTWGNDCLCSGTSADSDGDGVCDAEDICEGGDDNIDTDGDGIPDFCDTNCQVTSSSFNSNPLDHQGAGSSTSSLSFPGGNLDAAFTISGLGAKTNGNPNNRYIERVTVEYVDGNGSTVVEGVYNGDVQSSVSIDITGEVQSVTVTLEDGYDGNAGSRVLSVNLSDVTSCIPPGSSPKNDNVLSDITVYPNPATQSVMVELPQEVESAELIIYNAMGMVLGDFSLSNGRLMQIDLNKLSIEEGVILISIREGNKSPIIKRVLVMKE